MGVKTLSKFNTTIDNPGPGAYEPSDLNKPNPKSFKISTRSSSHINKGSLLNPGPGHYKPNKIQNNIPKWTMGSKSISTSFIGRLEKMNKDNPAPGNYDVSKSINEGIKVILKFKKVFNEWKKRN